MFAIRCLSLALLPMVLFGCGGGGGGDEGPGGTSVVPVTSTQLEINLTDAPGDFTEVVVTIDRIEISTTRSEGLVPLKLNLDGPVGGAVIFVNRDEGSLTVDLNRLTNGRSIKLATGEVPDGYITRIRLHVVDSDVNGTPTPWVREALAGAPRERVKLPSKGRTGIDILPRNVLITGGSPSRVTIDFNAQKSIVLHTKKGKNGEPDKAEFHLKPVIFLLESESTATPPTTIAAGFNFPRGLAYMRGDPNDPSDDRIAVANTGTLSFGPESNANTVVRFDPNDFTGIAARNIADPELFAERATVGSALRDISGIEMLAGWQAIDAVDDRAIVRLAPDDLSVSTRFGLPVDKLLAITQAPSVVGAGPAWLVVYQDGGKKGSRVAYFDPALGPDPIVLIDNAPENPTDILFVPGYPAGRLGTVYLAARGKNFNDTKDDRLLAAAIVFDGQTVRVDGSIIEQNNVGIDFLNEPIGMGLNVTGDGIWVAQRGNGFIHLLGLDLDPLDILNTGLGGNALNGIEVLAFPALAGLETEPQVLLLTNTLGDDDPASDDPLDEDDPAISSVEAVVPR